MNYSAFINNFYRSYYQDNQGMRIGQFFMNELSKHDLNLYRSIPADLDPFHNDKVLDSCIEWASYRWVDT